MPALHTCPEIDATPPITSLRQTKTRSRSRASPRKSNKSHMTLVSRSAESEGQSQNACTAIEAKPHIANHDDRAKRKELVSLSLYSANEKIKDEKDRKQT